MKKYLLLLGITYLGSAIAAEPVKSKKTDKQQITAKQTQAKNG